MGQDVDFQEALEMVRKWEDVHLDQFYELFPETVKQETQYDMIGLQQHDEEDEFAPDLEEDLEEKDERHLRKQFQSNLAHLSDKAGREAAAAQNLTVYNHAMTLWNQAEDTQELLEYLEKYAEERTDWDERTDQEKTDEDLLQEPRLDYGDTEDAEYVEEILTQLVTETMHEV